MVLSPVKLVNICNNLIIIIHKKKRRLQQYISILSIGAACPKKLSYNIKKYDKK